MPYDLYGTYYASARDAENAEMAQCAAIDASYANKKVDELERMLQYRQQQPVEPTQLEHEVNNLKQHIQSLEERIKKIESFLAL